MPMKACRHQFSGYHTQISENVVVFHLPECGFGLLSEAILVLGLSILGESTALDFHQLAWADRLLTR
jgi:hypothetical protein